jgi:hypothetical protein
MTWDFTSPPKSHAVDFIAIKNLLSLAGYDPVNLGSSGKHAIH